MQIQKGVNTPVRFLEGQKVYLRPIGLDDTELYFRMLFHPETRRLTGTQRSFTREQIYRYIEGKTQDSSSLLLLIALRETDVVIGDIALQDIDSFNRSANIRIMIDEKHNQGKGRNRIRLRLSNFNMHQTQNPGFTTKSFRKSGQTFGFHSSPFNSVSTQSDKSEVRPFTCSSAFFTCSLPDNPQATVIFFFRLLHPTTFSSKMHILAACQKSCPQVPHCKYVPKDSYHPPSQAPKLPLPHQEDPRTNWHGRLL